jgi:hypothetical protein
MRERQVGPLAHKQRRSAFRTINPRRDENSRRVSGLEEAVVLGVRDEGQVAWCGGLDAGDTADDGVAVSLEPAVQAFS